MENKTNVKIEIVETEDYRIGVDVSVQLRQQTKVEMSGNLEHRLALVLLYIKLQEAVDKLGWLEHTADWDLSTTIELAGGEIIYGGTGYPELTVLGFNIEEGCIIDENIDYEVELVTEFIDEGEETEVRTTRRFKLSEIERIILVD